MTCVRHRDTFRGDCSFRTFLLRVARSRLYDFFRARSRSQVDPDLGVTSIVDLGTRVSRAVAGKQEHAAVVEALRELPVAHQVVLELQYWEELSATEIAAVVEEPVGTVKSRLRRAKQLLAERVQARLEGGIAVDKLDASLRATRPPAAAPQ
jgi:RNA polymerase sigma-70 factor (ECF subfamily)